MNQKNKEYKNEPTSKSIFNYVTDVNRFNNETTNSIQKQSLPGSSFSLTGIPASKLDIENEMRGNNKILSSYACKDLSKLNN
jgi:hypothetical protein